MTWYTSAGQRFLIGAEAALFSRLILTMIDLFDDDHFEKNPELNYGYPLIEGEFENLTTLRKFTVLHDVAIALLTDTGDTYPSLNHINEGAIYYVYRWAIERFDDFEGGVDVWGGDIIKAYDECFPVDKNENDEDTDADDRPTLETQDKSVWKDAIERLADRILWDRDFEMFKEFGGGSDPRADAIKRRMDIPSDYYDTSHSMFTARPKAKAHLYTLCSRIVYPERTTTNNSGASKNNPQARRTSSKNSATTTTSDVATNAINVSSSSTTAVATTVKKEEQQEMVANVQPLKRRKTEDEKKL
mmetsp:Transcript_3566/g.5565  ORF Transcript_3566/g.5565 Transcript_3566/m.5565 type:complete len:302 (+) Transcript_3566:88-993(+)